MKLLGNLICHHQSSVGRYDKAWSQMALFITLTYQRNIKSIIIKPSVIFDNYLQFFKIAYCDFCDPCKSAEWRVVCKKIVDVIGRHKPGFLLKQKIYLILHLVDCMEQF